MRLEEILPEIRKGRKAKRKHWEEYQAFPFPVTKSGLEADDWELEPHLEQCIVNGWILQEEPGYGVNIYLKRDEEVVAQFSFDVIQRMKEFADRLRGGIVQDTQQYNNGVDPNYREYKSPADHGYSTSASREYDWGFMDGHKAGWNAREKAQ